MFSLFPAVASMGSMGNKSRVAQRRQKKNLAAALFCISMMGCDFSTQEVTSDAIHAARVFGIVLPLKEVCDRIPNNAAKEDSIIIAERYIEQWIREQVLVHEAETHLSPELQTFESEIQTYRNALLLHHYKERYVKQRMALEVPEEDAITYYEAHKDLFVLTDYAVRATFIHLPRESDDPNEFVETAMMDADSTTSFPLQQWCVEHGAVHSLDPASWWYLEDLIQEVPIELYRTEKQLANRKLVQFEAEGRTYFLRFLEHALIDNVAPFQVVQDRVSELILHRQKQKLLLQLEEELLIQAWEEGNVEKMEIQ